MLYHSQAWRGAQCIQAIESGGDENLRRIYLARFGGPIRFLAVPTPSVPNELRVGIVARGDGIWDVFFAGINGPRQGREVAFGYADMERPGMALPANGFFMRIADDVGTAVARIIAAGERPRFRFWGHSAGGAAAEVGALMAHRAGAAVLSVCTFGAPKPGFSGCCLEGRDVSRNRYMAWGDPVPLIPQGNLPARGVDSIALSIVLQDARPWQCVHGSGGLLITGNRVRAATDAQGDSSAAELLQRWVAGDPITRSFHSIGNYVILLQAAAFREDVRLFADLDVLRRTAPRPDLDRSPPADLVLEGWEAAPASTVGPSYVIPIELARTGATSPPAIVYVGERGLTTTTGVLYPTLTGRSAMAQAKLRGRLMMTRVRVGSGWGVVWNDFLIASFATPSSARTFVRAGNRFLRLMGNRGTLYMPTFTDAFASFIATASDGDPDYVPPLVVAS